MSGLGNWAENNALDWLLLGATPTRPTSLTLHLYADDPADGDTGTELSVAGYSSQTIAFGAAGAVTDGQAHQSTATITFTASSGSEVATHMAIKDNSGNLLFRAALTVSRTLSATQSIVFNAGDIVCQLD